MVTTVEANVVLIFATFTSCFTFVTTLDTCRQKRRSRGKSLSYRSFTESQRDVWTPTSSLDSSLLVMATSFPATSAAFSAQKYTKDLTQRKRLIRYSIFAHLMQCVSLSCLCSSLYVSRSRFFWIIPLIFILILTFGSVYVSDWLLAKRTCRHLDGVDVRAVTEVCRRPIGREVQCVDLTGRQRERDNKQEDKKNKKKERDVIIHVNMKSVVWFLSSQV